MASDPPADEPEAKAMKVPIAFPEDMYEWLREEAHLRRVSMAQLVREAVAAYQGKQ